MFCQRCAYIREQNKQLLNVEESEIQRAAADRDVNFLSMNLNIIRINTKWIENIARECRAKN